MFKTWLESQTREFRAGVEIVAMDGFAGFKSATAEAVPDATAVSARRADFESFRRSSRVCRDAPLSLATGVVRCAARLGRLACVTRSPMDRLPS